METMEEKELLLRKCVKNRKSTYVEYERECDILPKEVERELLIREVNEIWTWVQQRNLKRTPACILSRGVMKVAHARVAEKRRNGARGWLCGTYANRRRETIEKLLNWMFPEFMMELLIAYCRNIANGTPWRMRSCRKICERMLSMLVALAPNLHLNPFASDLFKD